MGHGSMKIIDWIRQVFSRMFKKNDIKAKLGIELPVSDRMWRSIELWHQMYTNKSPWLCKEVVSTGLAAAISSEVARMVTIEAKTEVTGSPRAVYINDQYKKVAENLRIYCELGCAGGSMILKPYVSNGEMFTEAVPSNRYFPLAFDASLNVTSALFVDLETEGDTYYTRFEKHVMDTITISEGMKLVKIPVYKISNVAYVSKNKSSIGEPTSLKNVDRWAGLEEELVLKNVDKHLYGYFRVPQANNIEEGSPMGISVYANAAQFIEQADKQWSRILWEYEGSELAVHADLSLFRKDKYGNSIMPEGKDRLFKTFTGVGEDKLMDTFSPEIRDSALFRGFDELMARIEDTVGLSRGTFSTTVYNETRTAYELKLNRQKTYSLVVDTQKALANCLTGLVYAMNVWASIYKLAPEGEYELIIEWDDSVITDGDQEYQRRKELVQMGLLKGEVFLSWYLGISEEEAKRMMPDMQALMEI